MEHDIVSMVTRFIDLDEEEQRTVAECIPIKTFKKGTVLLKEGQISRESYFTISGCVRHYYVVDGEEKTTFFYTEEQPVSSMNSYLNKVPANHYLSCVEDTTLAVLEYEKEKELYKRIPKFESICRASIEDEFAKQQEALAKHVISSPEERYLHLLNDRPDLLQRVPQYLLASYLGVKPESLSRIKKRISHSK